LANFCDFHTGYSTPLWAKISEDLPNFKMRTLFFPHSSRDKPEAKRVSDFLAQITRKQGTLQLPQKEISEK